MVSGIWGLIGQSAIAAALVVLGLLSKRLGKVTRAARYYRIFFVSAGLLMGSTFVRLLDVVMNRVPHADDPAAVLLYLGVPAFALTLSIITAWRYWSWLLAERS